MTPVLQVLLQLLYILSGLLAYLGQWLMLAHVYLFLLRGHACPEARHHVLIHLLLVVVSLNEGWFYLNCGLLFILLQPFLSLSFQLLLPFLFFLHFHKAL